MRQTLDITENGNHNSITPHLHKQPHLIFFFLNPHQRVHENFEIKLQQQLKLLFPSLSSPRSKCQDSELDFNLPNKEKHINESQPPLPQNIATSPITGSTQHIFLDSKSHCRLAPHAFSSSSRNMNTDNVYKNNLCVRSYIGRSLLFRGT